MSLFRLYKLKSDYKEKMHHVHHKLSKQSWYVTSVSKHT